jgi:hypothetical protein
LHFRGRSGEHIERDQTAEAREHHVYGVGAGIYHEIDVLGAVVDGEEAPEEGDFVGQTMAQ